MDRLLCALLHPYTPVEQHRAVQHKGFHSKAKQTAKEMGQLDMFQLLEKEVDEMGKLNT